MDVLDIVAKGSAAAEAIKNAALLARKANLADLEKVLLDLRDDIATLRDANIELKNENRELREQAKLREEFVFDRNVYWRPVSDGQRDGPYCPRCYGDRNKANRMGFHEVRMGGYGTTRSYVCAVCGLSLDAEP